MYTRDDISPNEIDTAKINEFIEPGPGIVDPWVSKSGGSNSYSDDEDARGEYDTEYNKILDELAQMYATQGNDLDISGIIENVSSTNNSTEFENHASLLAELENTDRPHKLTTNLDDPLKTVEHISKFYTLKPLSAIPEIVDLNDLQEDTNKLLSQKEIEIIKNAGLDENRSTKEYLKTLPGLENLQYAIIRNKDNYYAIYCGRERIFMRENGDIVERDSKLIYQREEKNEENKRIIKLVQEIETGRWGILKNSYYDRKLDENSFDDQQKLESLASEIECMQKTGLLTTLYERYNKNNTRYQYEFVMPWLPISMHGYIRKYNYMPEASWLDMGIDLSNAAVKLREANILHRDIKPANIMITNDQKPVPIDFGISRFIPYEQKFEIKDSYCGTPNYMAPEVSDINNLVTYNEKTDVYSWGQTLADFFGFTEELSCKPLISAPLISQNQVIDAVNGEIRIHLSSQQRCVYQYMIWLRHG